MATNDDDLYDDLDDAVAKPTSSSVKRQKMPSSTSMNAAPPTMISQTGMTKLQEQIKSLKAENEVLKKNIGILYRTAKSELERKDRTIDQLQIELDARRAGEAN